MSSEISTRQYINGAGLALLLYDHILTWRDEVQYIWRDSTWIIKSSFLISRYFALGGQILNVFYSSPHFLPREQEDCIAWLMFQKGTVTVLLSDMEFIMTMRVYALYSANLWVGGILGFWFLFCRAYNVWSIYQAPSQVGTDDYCIPTRQPNDSYFFCVTIAVNQAIYWYLSFRKYRNAVRQGWSEHPLIQMVIWSNSWAFLFCAGLCLSLIPYDFYVRYQGHVVLCILICTLSIASSRLVLSSRSLKYEIDSGMERAELTSVLSTGIM